jgi:outer membrane protein TolC
VLRRAPDKQKPNSATSLVRKIALLLKLFLFNITVVVSFGLAHAQGPTRAPQTRTTQSPAPAQSPRPSSSPQTTTPVPNVTPSPVPSATVGPQVAAQSSGQTASGQLTLDDVLRLANAQVSGLRQAQLNERVAEEDVRQAQAAFLPKVTAPLDYIYTSPALGLPKGVPRVQSYIANNAISEYQALVSVAGDVDISGRLRATLARNRALLEAARAGTEVARSALRQATIEAYYGLAFATAQTSSAEQNLAAAQEFERITSLLLSGGEVAPVDLTRAQLQTNQRQGELEQARANQSVAADALRVLVGYDPSRAIAATELAMLVPAPGEVERLTADMIQRRPELVQFEAQIRAVRQDMRVARADRLPQLSYTINGGFDTDSLRPPRLREHTGFSAAFNLTIPIFDWGATRSRERQAQVRLQVAENERAQALRGFAQQFNSARTQALSAATRIRLAGTGITLAQSNLAASIARYRAGEAQIIEVTDAQTTLAAQRLAFFQALFDYQVALARLRQAAGQ